MIVYVDDIFVTGNGAVEVRRLRKHLRLEFEIKDLGVLRYVLGIEVVSLKKGI